MGKHAHELLAAHLPEDTAAAQARLAFCLCYVLRRRDASEPGDRIRSTAEGGYALADHLTCVAADGRFTDARFARFCELARS
jgi:hypothetical protein